MSRLLKLLIISLSIIFVISNTADAGGLSTTFVEVRLRNLKPGKTYSIREESGRLLIVKNTTESTTVDIGIDAEKPVDYNLVPGYEPIPDLSWVVIESNYFKAVGPGQSAQTDILINIPKDNKYAGKKYQVYIYSHTAGSEMMRMGIMSRILIDIEGASSAIETAGAPPATVSSTTESSPSTGSANATLTTNVTFGQEPAVTQAPRVVTTEPRTTTQAAPAPTGIPQAFIAIQAPSERMSTTAPAISKPTEKVKTEPKKDEAPGLESISEPIYTEEEALVPAELQEPIEEKPIDSEYVNRVVTEKEDAKIIELYKMDEKGGTKLYKTIRCNYKVIGDEKTIDLIEVTKEGDGEEIKYIYTLEVDQLTSNTIITRNDDYKISYDKDNKLIEVKSPKGNTVEDEALIRELDILSQIEQS